MSYRGVYKGADATCWRKIADYYREEITSGRLPPETQLPSTQELAKKYETSVYSVQYALAALAHEGLVTRRPRYGTVVNAFSPGLKVVGILILVSGQSGFDAFRRMLVMELSHQLHEKGCEAVTLVEDTTMPGLADRIRGSIRKLGIQAVISFACPRKFMSIFQKINIPCVHESVYENSCRGVTVLREEFAALAVRAAAERGCRKPSVITVFTDEPVDMSDSLERSKHLFFEVYREKIRESGMEFHEEWICKTSTREALPVRHQAKHGYLSFKHLWDGPDRPDALILFTDCLLPGVAQAIAECGAKVPEELLLITHSNSFQEIFVPFRTVNIGFELSEYAAALAAQVFREFRREVPEKTIVPYRVKESSENQDGFQRDSGNWKC